MPEIVLEHVLLRLTPDRRYWCCFFNRINKKNGNPFNSEQVKAIRDNMEDHLRFLRGAGSGKAATICAKVAFLNQIKSVSEKDLYSDIYKEMLARNEWTSRKIPCVQDWYEERYVSFDFQEFSIKVSTKFHNDEN